MKKVLVFCICCLVAFFTTAAVYAQFTGSSSGAPVITVTSGGMIQAMTVDKVKSLSKDAPVVLVGNITRSLSSSSFTFKDSTGEITIKVAKKTFGGVSIGDSDRIVIVGYVSISKGAVEVDVAVLMKA